MRDIASGKAQLGARQKGASLRQLVEAAVPDEPMDEQLFDDDVPPQRFEFVDGDDEGSLQSRPRTVQTIRNFGWSHMQVMSLLQGTLAKVSKGLN
jgi:hypothetical protein